MDMFGGIPRVAIYVRVSTEEQKVNGLSVETQSSVLREWARFQGYEVVDIFNDAGISARKKYNKRPELLRLLRYVSEGKIDLIIFTKLDRWFRNISEYYIVQEILEAHNVNWKTIHEDYETLTSSGRLKINIMLSVAQDEADRDSERIKAVFESKRSRSEPVTGSVPTGYLVENKAMVKDPVWAEAIACFFSSFLLYQSVVAATKVVKDTCGLDISYQLADLFLKKTAYYGYFNRVDDICPAYITKEQYDLIQTLRKRTPRKTLKDRVYLFSGLIFCGECQNRFRGVVAKYNATDGHVQEYYVYNCPGKYARQNCTSQVNMREASIELYLLNNFDRKLSELIAEVQAEVDAPKPQNAKKRASIKKKLSKLKDLYVNDLIDIEVYRKDYESLNLQLLDIPEHTPTPVRDLSRLLELTKGDWRSLYQELSRSDKQVFWRNSLSRITINRDRTIDFVLMP